jgi:2-dehydro-3-deoxyglucarate aldolase
MQARVAMIEHTRAVENPDEILQVTGLDAILIGPYDLSSSMALTEKFDSPESMATMDRIRILSSQYRTPCGAHVVMPDAAALQQRVAQGYRFIAYSIDAVFLNNFALAPKMSNS